LAETNSTAKYINVRTTTELTTAAYHTSL